MLRESKFFVPLMSLVAMLLFFGMSCNSGDEPPIEVGYVNFQIYPNSTEYLLLNSPGGWAYVTANSPSRGVIIYRLSMDEFKAYERTPTYKPDSCCIYYENYAECSRLIVEDYSFALDTCAGSKYLLIDGSPISGPAQYPMVQYNTNFDGETLFVYN